MANPIRKIVVVGRDAAAWLAAFALEQTFGRKAAGIEVELVELPSKLRPEDVFVTLPAQQALHRMLGLDEIRLLRACAGLYVLGQRFSNWSGAAPPFLHAYDTHGITFRDVGFFQYWLKAHASGLKVPLEEFSLGAVAAKQGRFVVFNKATEAFSNATYGYHLSAIPYLNAIGKSALAAGLKHTVGEITSIVHRHRHIESVTLKDGSEINGDLFIDASGPEGCLIRYLEKDNFESWQAWLPCDRLMTASGPVLNPVPAFSQISAFRQGWMGIYPLMNRTGLSAAYASQYMTDDDALRTMSTLSGLRLDSDAVVTAMTTGRRIKAWIGNCVAVGDTAVMPDPLDAIDLHPLHTAISFLVSLLPVDRDSMPEAELYNAKMAAHAARVRDFQISHYKLNRRYDEPFWDAMRNTDAPEPLASKLRLFESRGMVQLEEEETFQEENWTSILVGHNLIPKSWNPLVDRIPEQEQIANLQRILKFIAAEVEAMPSLQAHLELNAPSPASDYIF